MEVLVPILAALGFGSYPAAAKAAYADGANAVCVILVTTVARAAALALFCFVTGRTWVPRGKEWRSALTGGFFQALSILGILASLTYLPAAVSIIIVFTHTIMLLLYTALRGEQRLTWLAVLSTLGALVGISFVVDVWSTKGSLPLMGLALAFSAAVATMSRIYVFGKQVQSDHPAVVGARVFTMSSLFVPVVLFYSPPVLPASSAGYFALGLCSASLVAGTFGMFYGIALIGAFRYSLLVKVEPIVTAIMAYVMLGEVLSSTQYAGIVIVLVSLVTYQALDSRTRRVVSVSSGGAQEGESVAVREDVLKKVVEE